MLLVLSNASDRRSPSLRRAGRLVVALLSGFTATPTPHPIYEAFATIWGRAPTCASNSSPGASKSAASSDGSATAFLRFGSRPSRRCRDGRKSLEDRTTRDTTVLSGGLFVRSDVALTRVVVGCQLTSPGR